MTKAHAVLDADRQVVDVEVDGGYWPSQIIAAPGLPLRIRFHRLDADACTERVVFSRPRLGRVLKQDATTSVDIPAQASGEIRFTCGMGRYHGRIVVADGKQSAISGWLRSVFDRLRGR